MSEEFQKLRNNAVIASVAVGIGGAIIYLSPMPNFIKSLGSAIAISSLGSLAATQFLVDTSEKIGEGIFKSLKFERIQLAKERDTTSAVLTHKLAEMSLKEIEIASQAESIQMLTLKNNELQSYIQQYKDTIKAVQESNSEAVVELLRESFSKIQNQVKGLLAYFGKQYPEVIELQEIGVQYAEKVEKFTREINAIATFTHPDELIEAGLALQHEIIHHTALLKMKAYKAVVDYLENTLEGMVSGEYHQDAIAKIKEYYESNYKSVIEEYSNLVEGASADFSNDLQQLCSQGLGDAELIAALKLEIHKLTQEIRDSRKPHQFIGGVEQPTAGNAIANYYFKLGYVLDGSDWEPTETGYTLYFYKDRNERYVDLTVLNDDTHPDKLKEFTNSLNLPQFKQSSRTSRIYLEIQKSYPVKKLLSEDDVKLIIGSPEEFTKYITQHPIRYRLIADPGVGKTPTTAVMISEILKKGCTKGNTGKGEKVPYTLVNLSST